MLTSEKLRVAGEAALVYPAGRGFLWGRDGNGCWLGESDRAAEVRIFEAVRRGDPQAMG